MGLNLINLYDLLSTQEEEKVKELLSSFSCNNQSKGANDVEYFLHNKAIEFEKVGLSKTYLVMSTYRQVPFIAGYFSLSSKSLVIPKKHYQKLNISMKKRLMSFGAKSDLENYQTTGFLLGQLGKNCSTIAQKAESVTGEELLALVYKTVKQIHMLVGGRILYLECENNPKIIQFYIKNGFALLNEYETPNGLSVFVKKIEHIF
ncbi:MULTISPECIES: GNAT family acetyltransferase [Listeria]|uniref:GNAT family acetyltransferase n=1 Tax=Listeria TaxID=1637 RepID=UPI000B58CB5C|nr:MULTISPECIES: GNAT family acetyltransferase [Listeria]